MTASDEDIYFWMVKPPRGLRLPSPDLIYNFFDLLIFTASCLDSLLFTLSQFCIIFILSPTPFPLCFLSCFLPPIAEFELDRYGIPSLRSQVRALHFCSLAVWLASISVLSRANKNKSKEDHQSHLPLWCHFNFFPTPYLPIFGFPFHFDYRHIWGVLQDFQKPLPLKDVSLHFTVELFHPSVATHFFH